MNRTAFSDHASQSELNLGDEPVGRALRRRTPLELAGTSQL